MKDIVEFLQYFWSLKEDILILTYEHMWLSGIAVVAGSSIAIPLGIVVSRLPRFGGIVVDIAAMLYTVPSMALLGFLLPFLGIGQLPTIVVLSVYSLLPLLRNTYTGITEVNPALKEAALGMGSTQLQLLWRVELPLALPVIMAGLRTVIVLTVGVATMGAVIGAGGLGVLVFRGLETMNNKLVLVGTIPIALLAISFNQILGVIEYKLRLASGLRIKD